MVAQAQTAAAPADAAGISGYGVSLHMHVQNGMPDQAARNYWQYPVYTNVSYWAPVQRAPVILRGGSSSPGTRKKKY